MIKNNSNNKSEFITLHDKDSSIILVNAKYIMNILKISNTNGYNSVINQSDGYKVYVVEDVIKINEILNNN